MSWRCFIALKSHRTSFTRLNVSTVRSHPSLESALNANSARNYHCVSSAFVPATKVPNTKCPIECMKSVQMYVNHIQFGI